MVNEVEMVRGEFVAAGAVTVIVAVWVPAARPAARAVTDNDVAVGVSVIQG